MRNNFGYVIGFSLAIGSSGLVLAAHEAATATEAIDDRRLDQRLVAEGEALIEQGKTVPLQELRDELQRAHCDLALRRPSARLLRTDEIYTRCRESVVIVGGIYKCGKCPHWHASTATAFTIAEPDVFVTNYHVVNDTNATALVVMTRAEAVYPVREVLAADAVSDVAIIRVPGAKLRPLVLRADAPVGANCSVISHPEHHAYFFSRGIIARYGIRPHRGQERLWMQITADYGKGSSGAPVLDDFGNAIGMAANTSALFVAPKEHRSVQMVFKDGIPAAAILNLIKPTTGPRR